MSYGSKYYGYVATKQLDRMVGYDRELGHAAKAIYLILSGHSDADGKSFPSQSEIGRKLGISQQAVSKQIDILVSRGYIISEETYAYSGARMPNTYYLNHELVRDEDPNAL
jgi:biotin operon repressor